MVDIARNTANVLLPAEISGEIRQKAQEASAVMALSRVERLPGAGKTIEVITADPTPNWVAETAEKPVSRPAVGSQVMQGYKMAVIVPFSNEFRRDKNALYNALVNRLPGTLSKKFDDTILFGTAPGSNFDVLTGVGVVDIDNTGQTTYDNLVDAEVALAEAGYVLDGFALSARGVGLLRKVKDGNGLPLLGSLTGFDNLLGYRVRRTQAVHRDPADAGATADTVGFAGDWSQATVGIVDDLSVKISDQATINDGGTQLNLWQRNMFAVLVEMEVGFRVSNLAAFRRLTGANTAP